MNFAHIAGEHAEQGIELSAHLMVSWVIVVGLISAAVVAALVIRKNKLNRKVTVKKEIEE